MIDPVTIAKWRAYAEARAERYGLDVDECVPWIAEHEHAVVLEAEQNNLQKMQEGC